MKEKTREGEVKRYSRKYVYRQRKEGRREKRQRGKGRRMKRKGNTYRREWNESKTKNETDIERVECETAKGGTGRK